MDKYDRISGCLCFPHLRCSLTKKWLRYAWTKAEFSIDNHVIESDTAASEDDITVSISFQLCPSILRPTVAYLKQSNNLHWGHHCKILKLLIIISTCMCVDALSSWTIVYAFAERIVSTQKRKMILPRPSATSHPSGATCCSRPSGTTCINKVLCF